MLYASSFVLLSQVQQMLEHIIPNYEAFTYKYKKT